MKKRMVVYILWFISFWFVAVSAINYIGGFSRRSMFLDYFTGVPYSCNWIIKVVAPFTAVWMIIFILSSCYLSQIKFIWRIRIGKREKEICLFKKRMEWSESKIFVFFVPMTVAFCILSIFILIFSGSSAIKRAYTEWPGDVVVTHAGGEIDGNAYTNSKEALLQSYELGNRTFEIDLELTSDDKVVCVHDWNITLSSGHESGVIETEEKFLKMPILGKYTPLSFGDLLKFMDEYPDVWIVTDSKYTEEEEITREFESMLKTARELGLEHVLDRLVIQIYNCEMYDIVRRVYPFESWNFTLYQIWGGDKDEFRDYAKFCFENDIKSITMWSSPAREEIFDIADEYGLDVYVHTINDPIVARIYLFHDGIRGVYTDVLLRSELEGE